MEATRGNGYDPAWDSLSYTDTPRMRLNRSRILWILQIRKLFTGVVILIECSTRKELNDPESPILLKVRFLEIAYVR